MFRPTFECLERREVFSASPATAMIQTADPQVSMALTYNESFKEVVFNLRQPGIAAGAIQLLPHVEQDAIFPGSYDDGKFIGRVTNDNNPLDDNNHGTHAGDQLRERDESDHGLMAFWDHLEDDIDVNSVRDKVEDVRDKVENVRDQRENVRDRVENVRERSTLVQEELKIHGILIGMILPAKSDGNAVANGSSTSVAAILASDEFFRAMTFDRGTLRPLPNAASLVSSADGDPIGHL